jgi:hypothetical protein
MQNSLREMRVYLENVNAIESHLYRRAWRLVRSRCLGSVPSDAIEALDAKMWEILPGMVASMAEVDLSAAISILESAARTVAQAGLSLVPPEMQRGDR